MSDLDVSKVSSIVPVGKSYATHIIKPVDLRHYAVRARKYNDFYIQDMAMQSGICKA